jgi:hypothetical protein
VWRQCPSLAAPWRKPQTHNSIPAFILCILYLTV